MNTALMKILIPMLPNQLKTNTNPLVALTQTQALKQSTAGRCVVEDAGTGEDEAGGDFNSKLNKERKSTNKSAGTGICPKTKVVETRMLQSQELIEFIGNSLNMILYLHLFHLVLS